MRSFSVVVVGGGPAGLAAAISAHRSGASVLLIEREARLGGILKQCIHDGFGLVRFGEKLSGPEYAERFIDEFRSLGVEAMTQTFVTRLVRDDGGNFIVTVVSRDGLESICAGAVILATGCRERTAKQVAIHGTRPAGVFTAGTAQNLVNLLGQRVTRRCVILGSGDIGLIMARRLTLEGSKVLGVYEAKGTPSGLTRNIHQCLLDYDIPLHLSKTVTRVFGEQRLEGVEISSVDEAMRPIAGTQERLDCDALILSVGLIPENELAEKLDVKMNKGTKGPITDNNLMTSVDGVFSCGNALHVNDLVDYVSESGEAAGAAAARYQKERRTLVEIKTGGGLLSFVPAMLDLDSDYKKTTVYFRSKSVMERSRFTLSLDGKPVVEKDYAFLRPPEMERLELDLSALSIGASSVLAADVAPLDSSGRDQP